MRELQEAGMRRPGLPPGRFNYPGTGGAGLDALADQLRAHADALAVKDVRDVVEALESVLAEVRGLLP